MPDARRPGPLETVVEALHGLGRDLDGVSVAELLWLAARAPAPPGDGEPAGSADPVDRSPAVDPRERLLDWNRPDLPVYEASGGGAAALPAREVLVPRGSALPRAREIATALRPLGRPWRSGRSLRLDIDATVSDYARSGELVPAFRPSHERWFDLTVVVDRSPTMRVWDDTVDELVRTLAGTGVFRTLRVRETDSWEAAGTGAQKLPPRRFFSHPRRLVLVVTDCVPAKPGDEGLWNRIREWARAVPTVLLDPLPPKIWRHSGLDLPAVRVTPPPTPGARNTQLRFALPPRLEAPPRGRAARKDDWLPVPVVGLSPRTVGRWARTLMRGDPAGCQAVLVPRPGGLDRTRISSPEAADSAHLVESFLYRASSPALRLAVLCSLYPRLNTALMHIVRQEVVPEATTADVAEVVTGGLVTIVEGPTGGAGPVLVFRPGVRDLLTPRLGARDARRAHDAVSRFIAAHISAHSRFQALVPDPGGDARLASEMAPFAFASARTLRALGMPVQEPAGAVAFRAATGDLVTDGSDSVGGAPGTATLDAEAAGGNIGAASAGSGAVGAAPDEGPEPAAVTATAGSTPSEVIRPAEPVPLIRPGGRDRRPYFFLSYAHTPRYGAGGPDPDMWVERFFRDLCGHVMAMTDLPAGAPAGFMDREIRSGEGWSERLGEVLANCRVFVPLFSPRYFASEMCGKEWYAFAQRAIYHQAKSNRPAEAMVPALWVPMPPDQLPGPAQSLQYIHRALGDRYATDGLYGLIKLRVFAEEYEAAVYELAKRIASVADTTRIAPGRPDDYRNAPSAFGSVNATPGDLRLAVVAPTLRNLPDGRDPQFYGATPEDWNPYRPDSSRPLVRLAADLASTLNYRVDITTFEEELAHLERRTRPQGPLVLLVDRWALRVPSLRADLARLDSAHRPGICMVVAGNGDDPESRATESVLSDELARTAPALAGAVRSAVGRAALKGIARMEGLGQVLPLVVEEVYREYLRSAPPSSSTSGPLPRPGGPLSAAEHDRVDEGDGTS
ncbi:TIR-like protein FxsC [Streptomyces sp. NPDC004726]